MQAEIIAVGTEILLGQIDNTNASYVARGLAALGINVFHQQVVGDNPVRLEAALREAEERADLVVVMGGLGPTKDDLTKQVVAKHLQRELVLDEVAMQNITTHYQNSGRSIGNNDRLQALYIAGAQVLANHNGMAVGDFIHQANWTDYLVLPGPPRELKLMFDTEVKPALQATYQSTAKLTSRVLRFFGIGEAALAERLETLIDQQKNPTLATYAKDGEVTLRITASTNDSNEAQRLLDQVEKQVQALVGDFFYGYGDDNSLVKVVVEKLIKHKLTITAAESLTAGLFQSTLGTVGGVSAVFPGGFVTYAASAKQALIGVPADVIKEHGVVSSETATWMAKKAQQSLHTDIAVSFTGAAGPDSLEGNPAGTVWIGLAYRGTSVQTKLCHFSDDRQMNRWRAVLTGLNMVLRAIEADETLA
ncbi:competence/damage-inducible protein A [Furfurilactobacillus siliginis]|uniref:Putative competence-damage inducible protein n=1 Tax=Furfurilactobacillus siliginis TaxID=348151 RepID=A0A0R2L9R7_9LACO|nr:competence/damage-inducible protein A [Furfurilactobacillus siliginis]KRN95463.1 competence-damage inducible protein [Furfurilactobacillus siliginis]GEK28236.1 putative competence-damage inducible protein [Furfurilactobacillus siliginis]